VEVFGSKGMVCSGNLYQTGIERYSREATLARTPLLPDFMQRYSPTYAIELDTFVTAIKRGYKIAPDFAAGWRALRLADAARSSSQSGRIVILELD
jgi:myo-inositol 2-dehydrogenase / D-chiro-inositol 1-dehydrogenase